MSDAPRNDNRQESPSEIEAMVATADLFGRLLLFELDEPGLRSLNEPEVRAALKELGVPVPGVEGAEQIEELSAEFYAAILQPVEGGPLVQSLWTSGSYEGDVAVTLRKLAEYAGVEFDKAAARGTPGDHLGSILLLWARTRVEVPAVAERLAQEHLRWALAPLRRLNAGAGFYAALAGAVADWIEIVTERSLESAAPAEHPR